MLNLADAAQQDPLIPTLPELIIGLICFVVVFGVLGKMLLPRIIKTLNEREDAIQGGINRADEAQAEAAQLLEQYRAQLADARQEAARIREEAREQGAAIIADMRKQAQEESERILRHGRAQLEAERSQAVQSLRDFSREYGSCRMAVTCRPTS